MARRARGTARPMIRAAVEGGRRARGSVAPAAAVATGTRCERFPQARARRTYQALLDAARELFESAGYDATGSPEIARRAGAAVGTFYRYFSDKQQVLLEVMQEHLDALLHQALDGLSPTVLAGKNRHEAFELAVDALFRSVAKRPRLWLTLEEMTLRDPAVAALRRQFDAVARQRMTSIVRLVASPQITDPEAVAWALHAAATECAAVAAGQRGATPPEPERLRAALTAMIERTLFTASSEPV